MPMWASAATMPQTNTCGPNPAMASTVSPRATPMLWSARALAHAQCSRSSWEYRNTRGAPVEPDDENIIQPRSAHTSSVIAVYVP